MLQLSVTLFSLHFWCICKCTHRHRHMLIHTHTYTVINGIDFLELIHSFTAASFFIFFISQCERKSSSSLTKQVWCCFGFIVDRTSMKMQYWLISFICRQSLVIRSLVIYPNPPRAHRYLYSSLLDLKNEDASECSH